VCGFKEAAVGGSVTDQVLSVNLITATAGAPPSMATLTVLAPASLPQTCPGEKPPKGTLKWISALRL
jgi:hypothetical protein